MLFGLIKFVRHLLFKFSVKGLGSEAWACVLISFPLKQTLRQEFKSKQFIWEMILGNITEEVRK